MRAECRKEGHVQQVRLGLRKEDRRYRGKNNEGKAGIRLLEFDNKGRGRSRMKGGKESGYRLRLAR